MTHRCHLQTLKDDRKGAVALLALMMAVFLVGLMYYVVGIGDSIVFRESMQDAADSTAYSAAVYDARGMNIIATINIIMAVLLALLIALKLFQLLLVAINIISCLAAAFGLEIAAPVCGWCSREEAPYARFLSRWAKWTGKTLEVCHDTASGVAIATPWLSEVKSIVTAEKWGGTVNDGFTLQISMVPAFVLPRVQMGQGGSRVRLAPKQAKLGTGDTWLNANVQNTVRFGLPVADNTFTSLCAFASGLVNDVVFDIVFLPFGDSSLAHYAKTISGSALEGLMQWFPEYFCGEKTGPKAKELLGKFKSKTAQDACQRMEKAQQEAAAKDAAKKGGDFDMGKCVAEQEQKADDAIQNTETTDFNESQKSQQPKVVYPPAVGGSDYFAVWSILAGTYDSKAGPGTSVGAWGNAYATTDAPFPLGTAKAEFFYDIGADDDSATETLQGQFAGWTAAKIGYANLSSGLPPDAMYNLRWRARLRRERLPVPDLFGVIGNRLVQGLKDDYLKGKTPIPESWGSWLPQRKNGYYNMLASLGLFRIGQQMFRSGGAGLDEKFKTIGLVNDYTTAFGHLAH
jgi:hypothetical protein